MPTRKHYISWLLRLGLLAALDINAAETAKAPWVGVTLAGELCEGGQSQQGPFDYTNATDKTKNLPLVEESHYTKNIQMLIKGNTGSIATDLDYTLRAFPNHHKALNTIMYYQLIYKHDIEHKKIPGLASPVECYLQRAIHFSPQDVSSYMLYAFYLRKTKRLPEAETIYKKALQIAPDELALKYSYGLFLFELKKYPEAVEQARTVYNKNYPKQKLKDLLIKSGHWQN